MSDDLVRRLRDRGVCSLEHNSCRNDLVCDQAADRIEELEAENKLLNDQMAVLEEWGREDLNALPDCLMRLAPALVEKDELKAKLATAVEALEKLARLGNGDLYGNSDGNMIARATLAELKGDPDA